jgi:glycosyltransferase involved in cell wall biosynthesis
MWPELRSTVLYPPPPPRAYRCDAYDDYVFMVSRLTPLKRADLLLRALATADGAGIRAVIGGDGDERGRLDALAAHLGVADRVMFTGPLPEPDMLQHLARCRVVCFPPVSEDYGFVTVEAFASGKPVITCTDSGGPAELVIGGERGLVCAPTPEAMAKALRQCMEDAAEAERMGRRAREFVETLTWPATVRQLIEVH